MFSLFRPTLTWSRLTKAIQQNPRSTIYSKPPKEKIGPVGHTQGLLQSLAKVRNTRVQRDKGNIMAERYKWGLLLYHPQSFFAMGVFAVTLLAPAGWIMHHIPEYRQRSPPQP